MLTIKISWIFQVKFDKHICFVYVGNSQRLRPTLHEIISTKIKAYAERVISSRPGMNQAARDSSTAKGQLQSYQLSKQKRQNGTSMPGTLLAVSPVSPVMAPMGTAQATAKELLDSIFDTVVRIFGKMYARFKLI